jgi:hypothetical protein
MRYNEIRIKVNKKWGKHKLSADLSFFAVKLILYENTLLASQLKLLLME